MDGSLVKVNNVKHIGVISVETKVPYYTAAKFSTFFKFWNCGGRGTTHGECMTYSMAAH